ncbi:hypothetical protein LPJ66_008075 [Kickxella alabastrina]|uniref:Uncharacterized protein n=1 Tax=Kickxella alabastrina TaxID=61397 RepID=A0ACC1IAW2_9FUNG|nr:hypothetical protein LPJ66_008075 [Kickxella alabastrina]
MLKRLLPVAPLAHIQQNNLQQQQHHWRRCLNTRASPVLLHQHPNKSPYTKCSPNPNNWQLETAVAFDIDGVLIKGKRSLEEGRRALSMLNGNNLHGTRIPFVLLTNGGGVTEADKAADISQRMGVEISPDQVILAHSPMRALAQEYAQKHVLVVGGVQHRCADIARSYGFEDVSTPDDLVAWRPSMWPFMSPPKEESLSRPLGRDYSKHPFDAVLVFHDSFDFGRDLQVVTDVLRSQNATVGGPFVNRQVIPLYMSNSDLIFSNEYPLPRFGQGAYHVCLRAMWHALTKGEAPPLDHTLFGKPYRVQYAYAERLLDRMALEALPIVDVELMRGRRRIYAIGDNPAADIAGANGAGWQSVLVRTGVFDGAPGTNDATNPATKVAEHVEEAVAWIIEAENKRLAKTRLL